MKVKSALPVTLLALPVLFLLALTPSADQRPTGGLEALTVPENRLPPACRLQPPVPPQATSDTGRGGRGVTMTMILLFPTNPWIGREREIVATIARLVDGAAAQPDGPPLDRRQAAEFRLRWADGVAEAYRAAYVSREGFDVEVVAVRFDDEKRAGAVLPGAGPSVRGATSRVVMGPNVARVSVRGGINSCFEAIRDHIESLR